MTLEKRIQNCKHLTPTEIQIARYFLEHKEQVLHLSIQEVSNTIYVSKSAIHRLCKKLGFHGFNEIKVQLSQDLSDQQDSLVDMDVNYPFTQQDTPLMIAKKLQELYQKTVQDTLSCIDPKILKSCANLLFSAKTIDVYTHAHNAHIAKNFQDKMLTIGKRICCPSSFYEQRMIALSSHTDHAALILSYSGKASFILPILKKLDEKGIPVIFISRIDSHPYPQYVRYHLPLSNQEQLQNRISQYASHIALQYIMDVLFGCIYNLNRKENQKYLQSSIDFMDDRLL